MTDAFDPAALDALADSVDRWLADLNDAHDHILAVERIDDGHGRWLVRLRGEDKEFTAVWLSLGQRTIRFETHVLPAPEGNVAELYEYLLRRNDTLVGAHFSIGAEDAVFLRTELTLAELSAVELDRVLGTLYAQVEQCFQALLRIGFRRRS